jgi:hypothetical protein
MCPQAAPDVNQEGDLTMPRTAEIPDDETKEKTVHSSVNGIDETSLKGFVSEYEAEQFAIDEIMAQAAIDCQPHKDQQKEIAKAAAEAGIPKKPFKAKLRERGLERKAHKCREGLSEDQRALFDEISAKLGDMNLFGHALQN